jgi:hypothetical protein
MKKIKKHWPLILGTILVLYFLIEWGIGWIPGMTGNVTIANSIALVAGIILLIYGNIKK